MNNDNLQFERVAIFGTGALALELVHSLVKDGVSVSCFVDYDDKITPDALEDIGVEKASLFFRDNPDCPVVIAKQAMFASKAIMCCREYEHNPTYLLDDISYKTREAHGLSSSLRIVDWADKAILTYIELHVVDGCNLNCRGCSHFSNISCLNEVDPEELQQDLVLLNRLFVVNQIRLLGGEPLLHSELDRILEIVRRTLPSTSVALGTNGLPLLSGSSGREIISILSKYKVFVCLSEYPGTAHIMPLVTDLLDAAGIPYSFSRSNSDSFRFRSRLLPQQREHFTKEINCSGQFCRFLRDGRLSKCPYPLLIPILKERWDCPYAASSGDYFDLKSIEDSWDIVERLSRPIPFCRFCSTRPRDFVWTNKGEPQLADYQA